MTVSTARKRSSSRSPRSLPSGDRTPFWRWIAAAAGAGLILRLAVASQLHDSPLFRGPLLDAAAYDRWARAIAAGNLRGEGVFPLAPLYPYLCGLAYALLPDGPLAVVLIQHLAGACLAVGAGWFAGRLGGAIAGITAAFLVAFHGSLIAHENALLPEVLGAALLSAGVGVLALGAARRSAAPSAAAPSDAAPSGVAPALIAAAAGFLLGLDALVRPTGLVIAAGLLVWILVRATGAFRSRVRSALIFAAGVFVAVAPVTIRNLWVGGEPVLVTSGGGFNFYVGNHAGADGGYVQPEGVPFAPGGGEDFTGRAVAERDLGRPLSAGEVSRYWLGRSMEWIRGAPGAAASLFVRKVALVWNRLEIPQIIDRASMVKDAPLLAWAWVGAGLLMPLALLGLVIAYPRRSEAEILRVSLVAFTLATALFFVTDRYRIQAVPLLAVVAAGAVARLVELARRRKSEWKPFALALGGLALAFAAVQPQVVGLGGGVGKPWVPPLHRAVALMATGGDSVAVDRAFAEAAERGATAAPVFAERGGWYRRRGKLALAHADLERALSLERNNPRTWTDLGLTWAMRGNDSTAIACFIEARAIDPAFVPASLALGQALLRQRRPEEAIAPLRAALAVQDSAAVHDALGISLILTRATAEGFTHLERAVAQAPERPDFALHLALAHADAGDWRRAGEVLAVAVEHVPSYRPARLALARVALEQRDWDLARGQADALLARNPSDPEARQILAFVAAALQGAKSR